MYTCLIGSAYYLNGLYMIDKAYCECFFKSIDKLYRMRIWKAGEFSISRNHKRCHNISAATNDMCEAKQSYLKHIKTNFAS